ncbi:PENTATRICOPEPTIDE REPEAT-CONTAINING PROTEIN 1 MITOCHONDRIAL [Salix purpurea]|uniref:PENTATRICOPEPTIDE REPEAT-CONTAINING PROTEIN 1 MITOCHONDRIAL n=1 Tax=Salix purpurea TaxID=77065 RepID=A0A9Q0VHF4_SALPP|nr:PENTATRICOPEPTIDE REPEAT-CONTAINING PROTEIN 1 MITOCHONDRIAL [Salix purpurea]
MSLSKPTTFLAHLKTLTTKTSLHHRHAPPCPIISVRFLSFSSPEEAAAERRRRKRRLRIEPPLSSLNRTQQQTQQIPKPIQNPNAPKLPEPISSLTGNRLNLHNKILTLVRENDLEEAALYTRHSVYSNCKPTIYTVNAVLNAQLRQSKYSDLLSLHRFITQAGIAANVITHNLLFQTYLDCRKPDTALDYFKQMVNEAPLNPSPTTYRIMIKGLVDNGKLEKALELKDEMIGINGFSPDPVIYHYLMVGCVRSRDSDLVFRLYEELKEKMGGEVVGNGFVVYGGLMKGYFMRGMKKEAMECYDEFLRENLRGKWSAVAYNSVLDALCKNGEFDEALKLFESILREHNPPKSLVVDLGSFNVMVDGFCLEGRYKDAIEVFLKMGDYRCNPDTLSFNNLIDQLCSNGMLVEAEIVYREMDGKGVKPDEYTYVLLMDTCIKENRLDDGAAYFKKMVESGSRPNLAVYNRLIDELVKVGKIDEAKSFYDMMVKKLKMDDESYKYMMKTMSDVGKLDEVLKMAEGIIDDEETEFSEELQEFVKGELRKDGREEELTKLLEEKERQKAEAKAKEVEAAEASKRSAKAVINSLISPIGKKEAETESGANKNAIETSFANKELQAEKGESIEEATIAEFSPTDANTKEAVNKGDDSDEPEATIAAFSPTDANTEEGVNTSDDSDETEAQSDCATGQQVAP